MINALLTLFYTDYAGIPIATVGLVMLISRVFDGSSDIIMGVIVGKTKSKWGKSRPWLLWMAVPYVPVSYTHLIDGVKQLASVGGFLVLFVFLLQLDVYKRQH